MLKIIWVDTKKVLKERIKQLSSLVGVQEKQLAEANEWRSRGDAELNRVVKKLYETQVTCQHLIEQLEATTDLANGWKKAAHEAQHRSASPLLIQRLRNALKTQSEVNSDLRRQVNEAAVKMHELRMQIGALMAENQVYRKEAHQFAAESLKLSLLAHERLNQRNEMEIQANSATARYMKAESILGDGYMYKADEPVKQPERYCPQRSCVCTDKGCTDSWCNAELPF